MLFLHQLMIDYYRFLDGIRLPIATEENLRFATCRQSDCELCELCELRYALQNTMLTSSRFGEILHKQPITQFVKDVIMRCDGSVLMDLLDVQLLQWGGKRIARTPFVKFVQTIEHLKENMTVIYIQWIAFNGTITHTNTAYIIDKIIGIYSVTTFSMAGQHGYAI